MKATIPDWKGVPHDYHVTAQQRNQCYLQKHDSEAPIFVRPDYCTCPDYRYRKRDCKHIQWFRERINTMNDLPALLDAEVLPALANGNNHAIVLPPSRASLAKNLSMAQAACKPVAKDSYNAFHRYKYASAEALIEEGRLALSSAGLALVPVEQSLNGHEREGEGRYELIRKFLLIDSSGECLPIQCAWPVVPEKGRPLDKATAIASTLSLGYLLRDLLLMPRVDPSDDLAAQQSSEHEPAKPAAPPASEPEPCLSEEHVATLASRITAYRVDVAELLKRYAVPVLKKIPPMHYDDVIAYLEKVGEEKATQDQLDLIDDLAEKCKIGLEDFKSRLQAGFGTSDLNSLSRAKAAQLIARLEATLRKAN